MDTLYFSNSEIDSIYDLNNFSNLTSLSLVDMKEINLDDISIIRIIKNINFINTKIINEDRLIYLDKIEKLSLYGTDIKNIDTLVENKTLKLLMIDKDIYQNNKDVVSYLINRGVRVVDDLGHSVVNDYE